MGTPDSPSPGSATPAGGRLREAASEDARLAAVRRYDILDTPPDGAFDRVAALAARWFDTPIATVTIVDEDRIWFKAAHGLDGVTEIPREPGLCSSAVCQDGTYVVTDAATDPRSRHNSLVTGDLAIRFYAAMPITTSDGHRLGTVNVLDTRPRRVDEAGAATLADLAAVVMDELELRVAALSRLALEQQARQEAEQARHDIEAFASTLQRSLMPPALPHIEGLELASHYHTASRHDVGGDFYDVFPLTSGNWAIVIGDVCGKGAQAAARASLARHTIRAAASHDPAPTSVLATLNEALLANEDDDARLRFCTLIYGTLEPTADGFRTTFGTGGHPPAYHLRADGTVHPLRTAGGMAVGALADARFTTCTADVRPGDVLLLYTDGLTEARTPGHDLFGNDGLHAFLADHTTGTPTSLVHQLATLLDSRRGPTTTDDVAILALAPVQPTQSDSGLSCD